MKNNENSGLDFLLSPQSSGIDPVTWTYFDQLLNHRTIVFNEEVCDSIIEMAYCQLKNFESDNSQEPVTLILNTVGGSVFDGLHLINVIDNYKKPLNIICPGYCFSMGAFILCAGNKNPNVKKYCYPFSVALIHAGDLHLEGESNSVRDTMGFSDELDNRIKQYVLINTKISEEEWEQHLRKQWYLTSDQMLSYGLVDEILGSDNK